MLYDIEPTVVLAADAAALDTDVDSTVVDMAGYDGCLFMVAIIDSAATGVASLIGEGGALANGSDMAVLSGATATKTCGAENDELNNDFLVVDIKRPLQRYLRVNLKSATANIAYGETIAIRYRAGKTPVVHGALANGVEVAGPVAA